MANTENSQNQNLRDVRMNSMEGKSGKSMNSGNPASDKLGIPSDWEVMEFGEFAETEKRKYVPVENEDLRCLELEHFEQGTGHVLGWINSSGQKSTKNKLKKGQV